MRRILISFIAGALLVAAMGVFAPSVGAQVSATGTIGGTVVNATHQNAVVANQKVTLQRSAGNATQDIATTVSGQDGHFSFDNIAAGPNEVFAVYTQFQGGMFPSQTVSLGSAGATSLQLKVYDTTNDDAHLRVTVATLLVHQPRPVNGLMGIGEIVSIENTGTTAFVGTPTGDVGKPMRLLRFAAPPGASNLSLGIGFAGSQIFTTDKGFGSTATVPPGTSDFAFSIDIPYIGTEADLSYKAVYPTTRVVVLVPTDMFVNGKDFQPQGLIDSLGARYQLFTIADAIAGNNATLQLTDLPQAGEKSYLDTRALTILAAILVLLALLALVFYVFRGNIAPALRLIPAPAAANDTSIMPLGDVMSDGEMGEWEMLLQELLALEHGHTAGKVSDTDYRHRDRVLRQRLREILAYGQERVPSTNSTNTAATGTPVAGGRESDTTAHVEATPEQRGGGRR